MEEKKSKDIVPEQRTGKAIDVESSLQLKSETEAKLFFVLVRDRLMDINHWHVYAGNISAHFQLLDGAGREVKREARKGDYFKIDIPGPGSKMSEGYDWVKIEEIEMVSSLNKENFAFRVRPAPKPQSKHDDVAHFYSEESTSTFIVNREGTRISVAIRDRNTKPNEDASSTVDQIRDTLVGTAGILGFSKIQWKSLAEDCYKIKCNLCCVLILSVITKNLFLNLYRFPTTS